MLAGVDVRQRQLEIQPHERRKRDGDDPHGEQVDDRGDARIAAASEDAHDDREIERPERQGKPHHEGRFRGERLRGGGGVGVKIGHIYAERADEHRHKRAHERGEPEEAVAVNIGVVLPACTERVADDDGCRRADTLKQDEGELIHRADDHHRGKGVCAHLAENRILHEHAERPDGIIQQHGRAHGDERAEVRKHMVEQLVPFGPGGGVARIAEKEQHGAVHRGADERGNSGAPHAEHRAAEVAEDQAIVQEHVHNEADAAGKHGELCAAGGFMYRPIGINDGFEKIAPGGDGEVFHAARGNGCLIAEQAHAEAAEPLRHGEEQHGAAAGEHDAEAERAAHAGEILFAEILRHEHAAAARDAKEADVQQVGKLVCRAHARKLNVAQAADHDGVHHVHGGGKELLEHNGQAHGEYFLVERLVRKAEEVALHKRRFFLP